MISYINPEIELIPSPRGIDMAIQGIQQRLSALTWLQKIFGRALVQRRKDPTTQKDIIYPEVYNKLEPMPLMVNDNISSYCFFHANDPLTIDQPQFGDLELHATAPIDIIVWVDMKELDPAKAYNYLEELREQMALQLLKEPKFRMISSYIQGDRVFGLFTVTETFRSYTRPPFGAFRISGDLSFLYTNC
jgi:hypothetical protein